MALFPNRVPSTLTVRWMPRTEMGSHGIKKRPAQEDKSGTRHLQTTCRTTLLVMPLGVAHVNVPESCAFA
ncbi:hypothetical protein HUJ04_008594 [Dendroctonus ponderosae]|nr:hypothetical protein HUJ04_008594 [Dendroctonus ponderosae]KAH1008497.1 hypothetical protein HUJ05_009047 [Dendroctonus ponderosae]